MIKKITVTVFVVLSFIAGGLLPRPSGLGQDKKCEARTNVLKKDQGYKAGDYTIYYRTYKGRGSKIYQKIDIQGKHNLKGATYKKGATIEKIRLEST